MNWFPIALVMSLIYLAIQIQYVFFWKKITPFKLPDNYLPSTGVSIIIVARNESGRIMECVRRILAQDYPSALVELMIIDDHSTDDTAGQLAGITDHRLRLFRLQDFPETIHPPAFKKSAITLGVQKATHDLIVVTDADCVHNPEWLKHVVAHLEENHLVFQTSPVLILAGDRMVEQMQETEQLVLTLITASGIGSKLHDIANGANMAFAKKAFHEVHGYEGNFNYASGDDLFLVEKMRSHYPDQIGFTKSIQATVVTEAKKTWPELLQQRIRWSGKNKALKKPLIRLIWGFVGFYHLALCLGLLMAILSVLPWWPFLLMLSFKWVADYFVLQPSAFFFKRTRVFRNFVPLQLLYTWYILRLGSAMLFHQQDDWDGLRGTG